MNQAGTYVLIMRLAREVLLTVGHLGTFGFAAGHYCYVGSARGPGGVAARVSRHLRRVKRPHWHVDRLLGEARVIEIWATPSTERLECAWAQALLNLPEVEAPVRGFGSSDCRCQTHLFYSSAYPSLRLFTRELENQGLTASLRRIPTASSPQDLR